MLSEIEPERIESSSETLKVARRILIVAPSPPPYGGMALQARKLEALLNQDSHEVTYLPTNLSLPSGIRWVSRVPGARTFLRTLLFTAKMWKLSRYVEVIHVFAASWVYFFAAVYPAVLVGRLRGKRVVLNYRGGEARVFFQQFAPIARLPFRLATTVTTPSRFLQEVIEDSFGIHTGIVPNIIDLSAFKFRRRHSFRPRFVVSRHLEMTYDVECVLKAFRAIQQSRPEAELLIAGSGSERERLQTLVAQWQLRNVYFLGKVDHCDLPNVYDQCDIMLNASRADNFPAALLEAAAAGLPVVSTDPGGIPHIFENEQTALLVPVRDADALAAAAERVIQSPELGSKIVDQARSMVEQLDWARVREAVYRSYGFIAHREPDGAKLGMNHSANLSPVPKVSGGA